MSYIEIHDYTKMLRRNTVLNHINLKLERGKIYGLVGKNGSGKTMLIRAISGLITATEGEITVDSVKVGNGRYPKSLGIVIENITMLEYMSAFENLKMLNDISENKISDDEIRGWIKKFNLDPNDRRVIKKYSLGMCQKVSLIQAFMNNPDLIILDEPTNALDDASVSLLMEIIRDVNKNNGTTFIIASHDKVTVNSICDEIIEMRDGKIEG